MEDDNNSSYISYLKQPTRFNDQNSIRYSRNSHQISDKRLQSNTFDNRKTFSKGGKNKTIRSKSNQNFSMTDKTPSMTLTSQLPNGQLKNINQSYYSNLNSQINEKEG